jgi:hypothetical protein
MKTRKVFFCLFFLIVSLLIAQIPRGINYQGKLTDITGVALDGTHHIVFRIYDVETGGTHLFSETHTSVVINRGMFDVIIGSLTPIPHTLDFSERYYLELVVDGEVLAPRQTFSSVPYAFRAQKADTALVALSGSVEGGLDNYIVRWVGTDALEPSFYTRQMPAISVFRQPHHQ